MNNTASEKWNHFNSLIIDNSKYKNLRYDQKLSYALYEVDIKLYMNIRGSDVDPFYVEDDNKHEKFFETLVNEWKENE